MWIEEVGVTVLSVEFTQLSETSDLTFNVIETEYFEVSTRLTSSVAKTNQRIVTLASIVCFVFVQHLRILTCEASVCFVFIQHLRILTC